MSETPGNQSEPAQQTPNSDIVNLPGSGRDVQEGVALLTPEQQVEQLSNFFEDNYPDIFRSLTTDEGQEFTSQGKEVPAELKEATERMWAKTPDLLAHSGLLVLGTGLDHSMPHVSYLRTGPAATPFGGAELPEGVRATILRPSEPNGAYAVSLHGGPGWFGDGQSHDQFWLPLFAALAERSGVTVIDVVYPLPGAGSWEPTQAAVAQTFNDVKNWVKQQRGSGSSQVGLITFGTGFVAARDVAGEADFHLIMTPRIPAGFAAAVESSRNYVSLAALDTRGTPADEVTAWMDGRGAENKYSDYPSEHIIAAPSVWRGRVDEAAQWLAQQA